MEDRAWLIVKRWLAVAAYAYLGTLISAIFTVPLLAPWVQKINPEHTVGLGVLLLSVLIFVGYVFGFFNRKHIASALFHPPCWFAAVVGLLYFISVDSIFPLTILLIIILATVLLCVVSLQQPHRPKLEESCDNDFSTDITGYSSEDLLAWAKREKPIDEDKLLFGREKYVERIYDRLFSCPQDDHNNQSAKTLALLGELGSGKSSVINVVLFHLKQYAAEWIPVKVDAWARDPKTIDEQILDLVIDALGQETDVTAYKHIPNAYRDALKSQGEWWATLSHLMAGTASTEKKLKIIDDILNVLNKKLVIIIEDPDRGINKELCCERIFALLDRLKQHTSPRIKMIVTGGESLLNGDLRVIEFKEILNTPSKEFAAILNKMSDNLWSEKSNRNKLDIIFPDGKPEFTFKDFPFGTPRDVKHVIRDVDALWVYPGELRGEINLKQLVLLSLIAERNNNSFTYLKIRLDDLEKNRRDYYYWGDHNLSGEDINEVHLQQKLEKEDTTESLVNKKDESKSFSFRRELSESENIEVRYWIEMIEKCGKYQVVHSVGRRNYLNTFSRRLPSFDDNDISLPSSNTFKKYEGESDQFYLNAMTRIFEYLKENKNLNSEDVISLICTGQLSPYLYDMMKGEGYAQNKNAQPMNIEKWYSLADKIIDVMPDIDYTQNNIGHPASKHLIHVIDYIIRNDTDKAKASELIGESLKAKSLVGFHLLKCLFGLRSFEKLDRKFKINFFKLAFSNKYIFPDEINDDDIFHWKDINMFLTESIFPREKLNNEIVPLLGEDEKSKMIAMVETLIKYYGSEDYASYIAEEKAVGGWIDGELLRDLRKMFLEK